MSYSLDELLPKDYFKSMMEEKAEMLRKYLRDIGDPLGFQLILDIVWWPLNSICTKRKIPSNCISPSPI